MAMIFMAYIIGTILLLGYYIPSIYLIILQARSFLCPIFLSSNILSISSIIVRACLEILAIYMAMNLKYREFSQKYLDLHSN